MTEVMGDGDDQIVAEGTEVAPVEEGDLSDAPDPGPEAPDEPKDSEGAEE